MRLGAQSILPVTGNVTSLHVPHQPNLDVHRFLRTSPIFPQMTTCCNCSIWFCTWLRNTTLLSLARILLLVLCTAFAPSYGAELSTGKPISIRWCGAPSSLNWSPTQVYPSLTMKIKFIYQYWCICLATERSHILFIELDYWKLGV